jgi:hypothetical protein
MDGLSTQIEVASAIESQGEWWIGDSAGGTLRWIDGHIATFR